VFFFLFNGTEIRQIYKICHRLSTGGRDVLVAEVVLYDQCMSRTKKFMYLTFGILPVHVFIVVCFFSFFKL